MARGVCASNRPLAPVAYAQAAINSIATYDATLAARFGGNTVTVIAGKDLLVSGSSVSSQTATTLVAGNNLIITAAQNTHAESHDRQETETGLMISLERIDLQVEKNHAQQNSQTTQVTSHISSQGDTTILAGNQLGVYASSLNAGNTLTLQGADVTLLGGLNAESASQQDSTKHIGTFNVYHDPGKGFNAHEAGTQDNAQTTLVATTLSGQNINIKATGDTGQNGNITLTGVQATTAGTLSLDAGSNGTLNLNSTITETSQANSHTTSDLVYQKMQGQGSQQESGHANVLDVGQLNINAAKINVPLAQSLQQLTQQPGMDYLNQLVNDPKLQGKVNWSAVELAHQNWDYDQQGLTPAGAAIVAIVVAYFTAGAGTSLVGAATTTAGVTTTTVAGTALATSAVGVTSYTVAGAVINAGFSSLVTQASISFINNGGDIGKTLKQLGSSESIKLTVAAMLTAGVGTALPSTGFAGVAAQTATGCATGALTGIGCERGATNAAITSGAALAYNTTVGYAANAGPGKNDPNNPFYTPYPADIPVVGGQQPADTWGNNVTGQNQPGFFCSQGTTCSQTLNEVPFVNATAGLHDYIFNSNSGLEFNLVNNVITMPLAAAVAIPAAINNTNISWFLVNGFPYHVPAPVIPSVPSLPVFHGAGLPGSSKLNIQESQL